MCADVSPDSDEMIYVILWRGDLYFSWKQMFKAKNVLMIDLILTNTELFTPQDIIWWTGVVWIIVMFLSAVWTHSDGTHSLQSIHWWSDVMLHFSKSDEETN